VTDRPLVSIVTPSLNQGRFIEATIHSIRSQTYDRFEHIVVDGGSTDDTVDILRRLEGAYPMRWLSEPDRGMYDAVNKGMRLASGDILAYLNSDDVYMPWALQTAVFAFNHDADIDLVFGDGIRFEQSTGAQTLRLVPPFQKERILFAGSLIQPAVYWRRRLFERQGGFDSRLRYVGDLDYWLRAAEHAQIAHIAEVLCVERAHEEAFSSAYRERMSVEERGTRSERGADLESLMGRKKEAAAIRRNKVWQRRLWLRFFAAHLKGDPAGPWMQLRANGGLSVSPVRLAVGQLPRLGPRYLADAVRSDLVSELMENP